MGNSESTPASVPAQNPPTPPPVTAPEEAPAPEPIPTKGPGLFQDLHKKTMDVFPMPFDGFKFAYNMMASSCWQTTHSFDMPASSPSLYSYGTLYVGKPDPDLDNLNVPFLQAFIQGNGSLNAVVMVKPLPRVRSTMIVQTDSWNWSNVQFDSNYFGKSFTAGAALAEGAIDKLRGILLLRFLKRVSPRLDLGAEASCRLGFGPLGSTLSVACRYNGDNYRSVVTIGDTVLQLSYWRSYRKVIQFGAELQYVLGLGGSKATFGYKIDLAPNDPKSFTFHSSVDSMGTIAAYVEKRIGRIALLFSTQYNYFNSKCMAGIGITMQ